MQNHFNNQFNNNNNNNNNNGQSFNSQQFRQQIRDTKPHNFIQKSDQDMYAQNNTGYNTYHNNQQQQGINRPYVNYGVDSNNRPPVVSQGGGCCCSVM